MKLEVGMYIRTKDGIIDKVIIDYNGHCASPNCECKHISCAKNYYDEDKIVKASFNIIDILEKGDYVNGNIILYKDTGIAHNQNLIVCIGRDEERHIYDETCIKSIVTKEQFEQMEYRIGE